MKVDLLGLFDGAQTVEQTVRLTSLKILAVILIAIIAFPAYSASLTANWHFEEGSGSTVNDSSANSNDGTLTNMDTGSCWVDGKTGGGLEFDATDDYVEFTETTISRQGGAVSFWIYMEDDAQSCRKILSNTAYGYQYIGVVLDNFRVESDTNADYWVTPIAFSSYYGYWTHVLINADSGTVSLYLNGIFQGSTTPSDDLSLKYISGTSAGYMNGIIDEIRIYDDALTDNEIIQDYEFGSLVYWWKFDDGSGGTAADSSIYGNDGTLTNMNTAACWIDGKIRGCAELDGTDDYIEFEEITVSRQDSAISFWLYMEDDAQSLRKILSSTAYGYQYIGVVVDNFRVESDTNSDFWVNSTAFSSYYDKWTHVLINADGGTVSFYLDGEFKGSTTPTDDLTLKYFGGTSGGYLNGAIDEVRIYNRALSEDEIQVNYEYGTLAGYWSFNDAQGNAALDASIYENNGTLTGMDTGSCWVNGKAGTGLEFDGTNDYVDIDDDTSLNITEALTIETWIYANDLSPSYSGIVGKPVTTTTADMRYQLLFEGSTLKFYIGDGTSTSSVSAENLETGQWYHITAIYEAGVRQEIYIDGIKRDVDDSPSVTLASSTADLEISDSSYPFDGKIDEVKIYNRALSEQEVLSHSCDMGIIAKWECDENTGSIIYDLSGYYNDGYFENSPTWVSGVDNGYGVGLQRADSDYIDCGDIDGVSGTLTEFTVSMWVKASDWSGTSNDQGLFEKKDGSGYTSETKGFGVWNEQSTTFWKMYLGDGQNALYKTWTYGNTLDGYNDQWVMLTFSLDNDGTVKFYVNNELKYTGHFTSDIDISAIYNDYAFILGKGYKSTELFNGSIDKVSVYSRVLEDREVIALYKNSQGCTWNFEAGSGSTAYDSAGKQDGSLENMSTGSCWVDGRVNPDGHFGKALEFDGTDDYVLVEDVGSQFIRSTGTVCLWLKAAELDQNMDVFCLYEDGYNYLKICIQADNSILVSVKDGGTKMLDIYTTEEISDNDWHHLSVTQDGSAAKVFLDGAECELNGTNSTYWTSHLADAEIKIGSYFTKFEGTLDNIGVYCQALPEREIRNLIGNRLKAFLNRSYYTSETQATALCELDLPASELSGLTLYAKKADGTSLGQQSVTAAAVDLDFTITSLSSGSDYPITVELRKTTGGELLYKQEVTLRKLAANTGYEWKTDRKNLTLLQDGTPFFPIGLYAVVATADLSDHFQEISNAGFNTVIHWAQDDPDNADDYLQLADTYDLLVIESPMRYSETFIRYADYPTETAFYNKYISTGYKDNMLDAVDYEKVEDNMVCYYLFDEPMDYVSKAGRDLYEEINSADGYHPCIVLPKAITDDANTDWMDVIGYHKYWAPALLGNDTPNIVSQYTYQGYQRAKLLKKPFLMIPMAEAASSAHKRAIKRQEQFCQTYLSLIYGAKGIIYFKYPVYHEDSWDTLADVATQLQTLGPIALKPDVEQDITYDSSTVPDEFDPENGEFPAVQVSLKENPGGGYVLLAANSMHYSVDVTYELSCLGSLGTVGRLFTQDTYTVTNGEFEDTLEAYGVRAYTLNISPIASADITVTMDGTPTALNTGYPETGRPNEKNIVCNPSAEDASFTEWPDYFWSQDPNPVDGLIGEASAPFKQDSTYAYHGTYSIKLTGQYHSIYFRLRPVLAQATNYVFSVYLKSANATEQNPTTVRFKYDGTTIADFSLTDTNWTRKNATITIPASTTTVNSYPFRIYLMSDDTIWLDAFQVEEGSTLTEFED